MKKLLFLVLSAVVLFGACQNNATDNSGSDALKDYFASSETGIRSGGVKMIPIQTSKGEFRVWTKRIGNNPRIKLLLLHGGPGATHEYFECMESFLPAEGIEFIYYDQLGSGNSDNPADNAMWDLPRFVEEVEQVRLALGLDKDNFFLLGHSWGGILAMEYALKYQDNLKGLIISNMMADCPAYDRYAEVELAKLMNPAVLDSIRKIEAAGDFANPRYMALLEAHFYPVHVCRIPPAEWPEPVIRSFSKINQDLYVTMQGPSEFGISGKLETWSVADRLPEIKTPALVIGAKHDTMDPEYMKKMAESIPGGRFLLCPNGAHMAMWDDQETYMNGLISFLKDVDKK